MAEGIYTFPKDFLWGTATAAHHVEGDLNNSWAHWENMETGKVFKNQKHGKAVEWWDGRWREDFDRMQYLGNNTHRMSIEWARIQPSPDIIDQEAIAQYREMIEGLIERDIKPMITLHHFTNPMWIENEGGWLANSVVDRFARWTEIAVENFGDVVDFWCTFNEPMVYASQAYLVGMFYPGKYNPWKTIKCAELLLRAHAVSYEIIKAYNPDALVGVAKHMLELEPLPPKALNGPPVKLVRRFFNDAFNDAMVTGIIDFPMSKNVHVPELAGTYDYVGLNFYQRYRGGFAPLSPSTFFLKQVPEPDAPYSPPMWGEIYPQGLFTNIQHMWDKFRKPIYITETGAPDEGDEIRRWYIARGVHQIWRAINANIPVKGLYYWTLMDNFEWTAAYNPQFKFGLYETNFKTQERTLRDSGALYREIALANGLSSAMVETYTPQLMDTLFPGEPAQSTISK